MFGFPRLRSLVAEHAEEVSLGDSLLEDLSSFVGEGWKQEDDITPPPPAPSNPTLNFGELRHGEVRLTIILGSLYTRCCIAGVA